MVGQKRTNGLETRKSLLDTLKQHWEMATIIASALGALGAALGWIHSHFASRYELANLECRMYAQVATEALPIHTAVKNLDMELKWYQIESMSGDSTPMTKIKIEKLQMTIKDIQYDKQKIEARLFSEQNQAKKTCQAIN